MISSETYQLRGARSKLKVKFYPWANVTGRSEQIDLYMHPNASIYVFCMYIHVQCMYKYTYIMYFNFVNGGLAWLGWFLVVWGGLG